MIAETRHGFVCASAGVDASNAPEPGTLVLLPVDPDASAAAIREKIGERTGRDVGVIVSDSFGRPFRTGIVDVAIGVAGIAPLVDWRGQVDPAGHELSTTVIAVADEIASAAELVMGKLSGVPAAVVGLECAAWSARELVMPPERNLFPASSLVPRRGRRRALPAESPSRRGCELRRGPGEPWVPRSKLK